MAEINRAPRGTNDCLPADSIKWQYAEKKMLETASLFGFSEIRLPVFEHTEVFTKSVGDTTDVVQKEMYTFLDKGGRSITLRPELTAGVVRSVIEHGLLAGPMPLKVCYIGGCYRYEKPQAGRLREFHQFGIECFGAQSPAADAEVIMLADTLLRSLGLKSYSLHINSIGCPECRKNYHAALKEYFKSKSDSLCKTCIERLDRNPMRILDCKCPECAAVAANAPVVLDYLCDECKEHFEGVKAHLSAAEIEFSVDPQIVRGLDYYTKTVFEFVSTSLGAQATVCGGGRYDGLVEQMQGPATPALGFGMGIERLLMIMEAENAAIPETATADVYIAPMGSAAALKASALCRKLRDEGFIALTDITGRGLKAQMKYADKVGAAFTVVLGDDELENGKAKIKNMKTGEQCEFSLDSICDTVYKLKENNILDGIFDAKI
ncbi:MAG: histidine--tRNA ligase [Clostridia bacterium]|nr:histidine--tRNA ligase [Clostridia bacterium]MBQ5798679.1 histidine--tRNA ligase [Clostridia bacterium]MEE1279121.1 histidine--tRNA ligase [Acutalibacteraceae bacterium]